MAAAGQEPVTYELLAHSWVCASADGAAAPALEVVADPGVLRFRLELRGDQAVFTQFGVRDDGVPWTRAVGCSVTEANGGFEFRNGLGELVLALDGRLEDGEVVILRFERGARCALVASVQVTAAASSP
ncbi:MAG TPA: hypothetical protein PK625_03240 [Spirochaetales bacterium]|nr:hypothetical protein [Spirochaetales bacterium]